MLLPIKNQECCHVTPKLFISFQGANLSCAKPHLEQVPDAEEAPYGADQPPVHVVQHRPQEAVSERPLDANKRFTTAPVPPMKWLDICNFDDEQKGQFMSFLKMGAEYMQVELNGISGSMGDRLTAMRISTNNVHMNGKRRETFNLILDAVLSSPPDVSNFSPRGLDYNQAFDAVHKGIWLLIGRNVKENVYESEAMEDIGELDEEEEKDSTVVPRKLLGTYEDPIITELKSRLEKKKSTRSSDITSCHDFESQIERNRNAPPALPQKKRNSRASQSLLLTTKALDTVINGRPGNSNFAPSTRTASLLEEASEKLVEETPVPPPPSALTPLDEEPDYVSFPLPPPPTCEADGNMVDDDEPLPMPPTELDAYLAGLTSTLPVEECDFDSESHVDTMEDILAELNATMNQFSEQFTNL